MFEYTYVNVRSAFNILGKNSNVLSIIFSLAFNPQAQVILQINVIH